MAASVNTPNSVQSIPMDEIQIIREKELDGIKTIIMAGVGLLIIGLIVWDLSQPGWMGGPMI